MEGRPLSEWVLRAGVAFAFLYPPIDAWFNPYSWLGYFPPLVRGFVPDPVLLHTFGVVEIGIAVWILFGKRIAIPAALAAGLLFAIVLFDRADFEVLFRDISIAAAALSLALMKREGVSRA